MRSKTAFLSVFLLLFKTALVFSATSSTTTLPLPLLSLLSLKTALRDPLSSLNDWNPDLPNPGFPQPVWCSWTGVTCDPTSFQIISLDLSHKNLSGFIPPEIRFLSHLTYLNLSNNGFDGPLQTALFELPYIKTLDISHNIFNGSFPPGISRLRFLAVFNAYSNNFSGPLPRGISRLRYLEVLNLGGSFFDGGIPPGYGGLTRLRFLHLSGNLLRGPVPYELGSLTRLEHMEIGYNEFRGGIPPQFGLLSNLTYLDVAQANLSGPLPSELGNLTHLESLLLFKNHFTGSIPESFSNLGSLKALDLSDNRLTGPIPTQFSSLKELTLLSLMDNHLTGGVPEGIGDLPNLETLLLWNNSLSGHLPQKLGSNSKLRMLDVSSNSLSGPIPPNLCSGNKLFRLILFSNSFDSELPSTLANCTSLWRFRIARNKLSGSIPAGFGLLPNLTFMDLSKNNFSGEIPSDLGIAPRLEYLNISENSFDSSLPDNIWSAPSLQIFSSSFCKLKGKIPDFIGCKNLYKIEMEGNSLSGSIPWDIGHCQKLLSFKISQNQLTGIIPWELAALPSITDVDLSRNSLTGTIPSAFDNCSTLESFNVSYNQLTGPIPSSGVMFRNLHPSAFTGNAGLCGGVLERPCMSDISPDGLEFRQQQQQPKKSAGAIVWVMAAAFGIGIFLLIAGSRCFHARYGRAFREETKSGPWNLTAFQRLNFTAEDVLECLSMSDKIIGMGSTGTVYKAEMPGGEIIAVKKLWGKQKETVRRRRGVLAEVDVLGNVRHRNIVRLLGCCSNNENTLLLYEYMPNGSLDDLLHGKNKGENLVADWLTRYKIALGVAQGICYLHHDCNPVIVHRDLKPSNILLDSEMEARVADFGVAKLIQTDESMSVIAGSYGYIAPEYAYTLQVDEKSDIYSFGVVLMEILSGKRSVDTSEFGDGNSIVDWVRAKIKTKQGVSEVLDTNAGASCASVREEMMLVLRVALICTSRSPSDRPTMRDVVSMLQEAKPKRKMPGSGGGGGTGGDSNGNSGGGASPLVQKPAMVC
ncbi:leucine-rich repeat receptor-like protein kinase TDR [Magnolia sinica]|uniref:leucine-rich repeat receptor-like protein kinase TDR n=1 Tax=Magnolia sinica TaxID=86752 RepID=UPI0026598564|nr:leucine-rich repeat receptor-like protein kinase TDR [Magnolia sinica]